jgi:hypothetical protein
MSRANAFSPRSPELGVKVSSIRREKLGKVAIRVKHQGETDDEDDDGWGIAASPSLEELQALRNAAPTNTDNVQSVEPERDLFIPAFAIVSLLGLFGSYGYEMTRLASRGELYLPWN